MELLKLEEKIKEVMTEEISLFSSYREEFNKMKKQVMDKEWIFLQRTFEVLQTISNEIEEADLKRDDLYTKLCDQTDSTKEDSFYSVICKIHKNGNSELKDIFRIVKHEASSIKILNDGFSHYVQNRKNLVNEIMEELVPHRKGTIYNKKGFSFPNGNSSSLILNKHL